MRPDPIIGVVYDREAHPAAGVLADLTDPELASKFLCEEHLPLSVVLDREWAKDAHLLLYTVVDEDGGPAWARVKKRAPFAAELIKRGGRIDVPVLVFDHDLPKQGKFKQEWTEGGLGEFVQGLAGAELPCPTYWYSTLHGSRFIYVLTKPVSHLRAEELATALIARYAAAGIQLDAACADWTRLFRLPKTVRSDTGQPFWETSLFQQYGPGPALDPDSLGVASGTRAQDSFAKAAEYRADMPDPDSLRALLVAPSEDGKKQVQSAWAKVARKFLQGREPAFGVCFEERTVDAAKHGGRNNALIQLVGQVVGMTARQVEATPEGIMALIYGALEQLNAEDKEGTDWIAVGWDLVCRMWSNEQAQIAAQNAEREASIADARDLRQHLLTQLKDERPQDVPADEEEAEKWFRQRMIASDGRQHYVMRRDGNYNLKAVSDSMLIPMIRELGMTDVIETHELRGRTWVARSAQSILNDHATPIGSVHCSARERVAFIDGERGMRVLHQPVHHLNPKLRAERSVEVEEWLKELAGDSYPHFRDWLSHALDVTRPICALNLYGSPGTGKGMLAAGLSECFDGEQLNDGRVLGKFNVGLLASPIVNCDEGVPQLKSDETLAVDQAFRALVTGGSITIRSMYSNPYTAAIYPRILFTGNDPDIIRSISGHRDLTDDDIRAIELRLLSVKVSDDALLHLTARGNYQHTSGWVHGRERSKYTIANHIYWLFQTRQPSKFSSGRLLVEGEVGTTLVRSMRLRSQSSQAVLRALVRMIESPQRPQGLHVHEGRAFVTASGVVEYAGRPLSGIEGNLTLPRATQVLRQFSLLEVGAKNEKSRPAGAPRGRWLELDLSVLLEEALRYGMPCKRVESLLGEQPYGAERAAQLIAEAEARA